MSFADDIWCAPVVPKGSAVGALATFATRVPAIKGSRDTLEVNRRTICRESIVKLVDYAMKRPTAALDIWSSLESNLIVAPEKPVEHNSSQSLSNNSLNASTVRKLDTNFKCRTYLRLTNGPIQGSA